MLEKLKVSVFAVFVGVMCFLLWQKMAHMEKFSSLYGQDLLFERYTRTNSCGQSHDSFHRVISVKFPFEKRWIRHEGVQFVVEDLQSKNRQNIVLYPERIFYPDLFRKEGHNEYNLPICDGVDVCQVELFIFTDSWKSDHKDFEIQVNGKLVDGYRSLFRHQFPKLANTLRERDYEMIPRVETSYDHVNNTAVLKIPDESLRSLKEMNIQRIEVLFQWRGTVEQQEYSEYQKEYAIEDGGSFTHKLSDQPVYLGALIFFDHQGAIFESKSEVMNGKDPFFACKKP